MSQNIPMTPKDIEVNLGLLGLSTEEFAACTGTSIKWCEVVISGEKPAPYWLHLLMVYWLASPASLQVAKEFAKEVREVRRARKIAERQAAAAES